MPTFGNDAVRRRPLIHDRIIPEIVMDIQISRNMDIDGEQYGLRKTDQTVSDWKGSGGWAGMKAMLCGVSNLLT
jgi:hypothetical protein